MSERPTTRLRRLLAQPGCVMAPESADGLMARLLGRFGFAATYVSRFGTSLNRLGMPDVGLLTATEMVDNASRIVDASGLAVVADADTGYGNPINVRRTVRDFEKAGVAAVHIEDQVSPKRCAHLSGKRVIPAAEMVAKIKAACDARRDPDFVVIARTDVLAVDGMQAVVDRAARYREAGADMIFVDAPVGREQTEAIARGLSGIPLLCNIAARGKTPDIPAEELGRLGFKLAIYTNCALLAAIPAIEHMLGELKARGGIGHLRGQMADFREFTDIAGLAEIQDLEARYGVPDEERTTL